MRILASLIVLSACSNASDSAVDAPRAPDAAIDAAIDSGMLPALAILVVNEVAPGETPDWFEIVNISSTAVQLDQFSYVDVAGDHTKAKAFPAMTLAPGAYFVQDVDDTLSGFKLGSDEELWIYRVADKRLSDGIDWPEGAAPAGMSYRRVPDKLGSFVTGAQSRGLANP